MTSAAVWTVRRDGTFDVYGAGGGARIERGTRLIEWGRRENRAVPGVWHVTVSIARTDPFLGEYVSVGMRRFTILMHNLELLDGPRGTVEVD